MGKNLGNLKGLLRGWRPCRWRRRSWIISSRYWRQRCWSQQMELLGKHFVNGRLDRAADCNPFTDKNGQKDKVHLYRRPQKIDPDQSHLQWHGSSPRNCLLIIVKMPNSPDQFILLNCSKRNLRDQCRWPKGNRVCWKLCLPWCRTDDCETELGLLPADDLEEWKDLSYEAWRSWRGRGRERIEEDDGEGSSGAKAQNDCHERLNLDYKAGGNRRDLQDHWKKSQNHFKRCSRS